MIKLVVINDAQQTSVHSFDRQSIVIGSLNSKTADLKINESDIEERHLEIYSHDQSPDSFFISNLTHDPFVTLNGLPFGKRPLQNQDVIQIGPTSIRFDIENYPIRNSEEKKGLLSIKPKQDSPMPFSEPASNEKKLLAENTKRYAIDFEKEENQKFSLNTQPVFKSVSANKPSLKDYYLSEYDDQGDAPQKKPKIGFNDEARRRWRLFFKLLGCLAGAILISAGLAYLWISDQSGEEEIMAAKSVADVAMALKYAQVKNIQPKNQNWSDPEFIKKNIMAVLAPEFTSWAEFDKYGQFACCPYILRIYTSHDLSQFLVIAQPAPSLLHWLVPKATIMIDSQAMEMRKIHDLKTLNRLLNNTSINGVNAAEISSLIKQGELIPAIQLNDKKENQGFYPPKALALIRPGAENRVYNFPRYYAFGQSLLKRAVELVEKNANSHEIGLFQQELALINKLPDLILYSSEGLQQATQSQKILNILMPREKFLISYLQMTSTGKITGAHLLMDDLSSDVTGLDPMFDIYQKHLIAFQNQETEESLPPEILNENKDLIANYGIDPEDPVFMRLSALVSARYHVLRPISDELVALLNTESHKIQPHFLEQFTLLQNRYFQADEEQRKTMVRELATFIRENTSLPAARLLDFVKALELNVSFQDYLNTVKQQGMVAIPSKRQLEELIKDVEASKNLQELEQRAVQIASTLNFDAIPDEEILISYQDIMRSKVIQKLNEFLLSADNSLSAETFSPESRELLTHILEAAWIVDSDTHDFYISEFEFRAAPPVGSEV